MERGGVVIAGYRFDDFVVKDADFIPQAGGFDNLALFGNTELGCKLLLHDRVDTLSEVEDGVVTFTFGDRPNDKGHVTFLTKCTPIGTPQS